MSKISVVWRPVLGRGLLRYVRMELEVLEILQWKSHIHQSWMEASGAGGLWILWQAYTVMHGGGSA